MSSVGKSPFALAKTTALYPLEVGERKLARELARQAKEAQSAPPAAVRKSPTRPVKPLR